jgi:hypothetical protein
MSRALLASRRRILAVRMVQYRIAALAEAAGRAELGAIEARSHRLAALQEELLPQPGSQLGADLSRSYALATRIVGARQTVQRAQGVAIRQLDALEQERFASDRARESAARLADKAARTLERAIDRRIAAGKRRKASGEDS